MSGATSIAAGRRPPSDLERAFCAAGTEILVPDSIEQLREIEQLLAQEQYAQALVLCEALIQSTGGRGEVALITFVALPLGCVMGRLLSYGIVQEMNTELFRVPSVIETATYGAAVAIGLIATILSAAMVRRRLLFRGAHQSVIF